MTGVTLPASMSSVSALSSPFGSRWRVISATAIRCRTRGPSASPPKTWSAGRSQRPFGPPTMMSVPFWARARKHARAVVTWAELPHIRPGRLDLARHAQAATPIFGARRPSVPGSRRAAYGVPLTWCHSYGAWSTSSRGNQQRRRPPRREGAGAAWNAAPRQRILTARVVLLKHPWAPPVFEGRAAASPRILREMFTLAAGAWR